MDILFFLKQTYRRENERSLNHRFFKNILSYVSGNVGQEKRLREQITNISNKINIIDPANIKVFKQLCSVNFKI